MKLKSLTFIAGATRSKASSPEVRTAGAGILTSDGTFLKFDPNGQKTALALLDKSGKTDHLRVNVDGDRKGDAVTVRSIEFVK